MMTTTTMMIFLEKATCLVSDVKLSDVVIVTGFLQPAVHQLSITQRSFAQRLCIEQEHEQAWSSRAHIQGAPENVRKFARNTVFNNLL